MKIRTHEMLYDKLTDEIAWRKKELFDFKALIRSSKADHAKHHALLRAGIMLLYSHWEGFIKVSAEYYIQFVSMQKLANKDLTSNFIAMCVKSEMGKMSSSNKIKDQIEIVNFFMEKMNSQSSLTPKNSVWTEYNLSSKVLQNIIMSLGLDFAFYETKAILIDEKLLNSRNTIAHGDYLQIDNDEYSEIHEKVIEMMDYFRNQIDNSASMKSYMRT